MLITNIANYQVYIFIIISAILLLLVLLFNRIWAKYIVLSLDVIISFIIVSKYGANLIRFTNFKYFYHNMYFYFLNSIIFMIINLIIIFKNKLFKTSIITYCISFIFLSFSLFMTYYLYNTHILILGNIYAEYTLGNYIYFVYYIIIISLFVKNMIKR